MSERARDYVAQYMADKYMPEELRARSKATEEWLEAQPCGDGLCECEAP